MRNYAIKQAISELEDYADPKEVERVAKRHMLGYTELKQAYNRDRKEKDKAEVR